MIDDDKEVQAFRAAMDRYLVEVRDTINFENLAEREHVHISLLIDQTTNTALPVEIRIKFGQCLDADKLKELVEMAKNRPGSVPVA